MKISLIGFGKMGQLLFELAPIFSMNVVSIIDPTHPKASHQFINESAVHDADICIDFSSPEAALNNIHLLASLNKSMVIGTTGWEYLPTELTNLAKAHDIGMIVSPNFSIGVYIFSKIVEKASRLINFFDDFDIACSETHHTQKKDSPSGTALHLANIITAFVARKKKIAYASDINEPEALQVSSTRLGNIIGEHSISIDSPYDQIDLTHVCKDRKSFAIGALTAAQWINSKKGFFNFNNVMQDLLQGAGV